MIFEEYAGQVVPIRFHTWWPNADDPFYTWNIPANEWRVDYYAGIPPWVASLYVPSFRFDGKYIADPSDIGDYYNWMRHTLDSLLTIPSPLRIDVLYNRITPDSDSVYVAFDVTAEDSADFNMKMHVAVSESLHRYPYPVGKHWWAFRHFVKDDLPDSIGFDLGPMYPGDSRHFEVAYEIFSEYRADRVVTNIFIQRNGTRKVQQAWYSMPEPMSGVEVADVGGAAVLGRSSPNPFSARTNISFNMKAASKVRLAVYTLTGRLVADLLDEYVEPGSHSVAWDGRDRFGQEAASGMYYYVLETDKASRSGKMILLR